MRRVFFALAFASLMISGCSLGGTSSTTTTSDSSSEFAYITPEYSIDVPASWEIYPKEQYPATILFAARQIIASQQIPASISISTTPSRPSSLEQFVSRNLEGVRKKSQDVQVVSQTDVSDASSDRMIVEYSERSSKDFSRIGFFALYVIPKNLQQSYVITLLFDEALSASEKEELQKMVLSFTLKENK